MSNPERHKAEPSCEKRYIQGIRNAEKAVIIL